MGSNQEKLLDLIAAVGEVRIVGRGELLLRPGEISNRGYFVKSGCLKSYFLDEAGKEHIMQFAPEGWLVSDMNGMVNSQPSSVFIEAIEESEVFLMEGKMENYLAVDSDVLMHRITMLHNNVIALNRRIALLLSSTAEERYQAFLDTYPTLANRLSQKLIASFIGITPEFLSQIRKKRTGK